MLNYILYHHITTNAIVAWWALIIILGLIKGWFLLGTILVRLFEASATRKWSSVFLDWGVAIGHDAIPWVIQGSVRPGLAQILQGASFGQQNWGRLSYLPESNCRAKQQMMHGYRQIWKGCMSAWQFKIHCVLKLHWILAPEFDALDGLVFQGLKNWQVANYRSPVQASTTNIPFGITKLLFGRLAF